MSEKKQKVTKEEVIQETQSIEQLLQKIDDLEKNLEQYKTPKVQKNPDNIEKKRLKDRELLVGTFRFFEVKDGGGHLKFSFQKWDGDPIETFLLIDGQKYALPRGVVNHLKESGKFITNPSYDELGRPTRRKPYVYNRYSFELDDMSEPVNMDTISRGYAPKNSQ